MMLSKPMYQNLNSCDELNYINLCKLYNRYKSAMKTILEHRFEVIADARMNEIDAIMQQIENYPLSWEYYKSKENQFTSDFELLVIFHNKISTN